MNESRRKLLSMGAAAIITGGLPLTATVLGAEVKPLTTDDLVTSLVRLAKRAQQSEMPHAAELLRELAGKVLKGEPVVPCDTDTDCERKNPRIAARKGVQ